MVLNRVVSFIDIRMTTRNKSFKRSAEGPLFLLTPHVYASPHSIDLALSGSF